MSNLRLDDLSQILNYDRETGVFRWKLALSRKTVVGSVAGSKHKSKYVRIQINGRRYLAHRLAWLFVYGSFPSLEIDHIDGNGENNAISNLREATPSQNRQNQRRCRDSNRTGLLGVTDRDGTYEVRISKGGSCLYLGKFKTTEEASKAYIDAKREFHEFCSI